MDNKYIKYFKFLFIKKNYMYLTFGCAMQHVGS